MPYLRGFQTPVFCYGDEENEHRACAEGA